MNFPQQGEDLAISKAKAFLATRHDDNESGGEEDTRDYRGVSRRKGNNKWQARIYHLGKEEFLGSYDRKADAARAYDRRARECAALARRLAQSRDSPV